VANANTGIVYTNFTTNNASVLFYWAGGPTNVIVQCSAMANGKPVTAQATFDVLEPSADLLAFPGPGVTVDDNYYYLPGIVLHFGTEAELITETNWGMRFYATNIVLDGCPSSSTFLFVQTGTSQAEHNYTNGTSSQYVGSGLDTQYPAFLPFSATAPWQREDDPPGEPVDGSTQVWRSDHFTMYLLFQPDSANSIPVPLKRLDWSWFGLTQTNGAGWRLISSGVGLTNVNVLAGYPTWTNNITPGITTTNSHWINPFP
jgi:hypothetical protein